ncbi:MAG TPA: protease inhibitor I42 family protein [Burkholderiaceae bacterium]|nr:protease inhibitor I42 family protein [Burkholderiaceae bacterium]
MAETLLTDANSGATVRVAVGDVVLVRLPENPTTGHRWQASAAPGLVLAGDEFEASSRVPGAGGVRTLRFSAQAAGVFHVRAALRRPWEAGAAPKSEFSVAVAVS